MSSTGRQFTIQRAVKRSQLHPICRHLLLDLASRINDEAGVILDQHQPSISELARDSGWSRSAVCQRLNDLERSGWLQRGRPTRKAAATEHARTRYSITIPGEQDQAPPTAPASTLAPDPHAQLVVDLLTERTGKAVSLEHAARVRHQILEAGGRVRDPAAYLKKAITSDADPQRWLPNIQLPPTVAERMAELEQLTREETPA